MKRLVVCCDGTWNEPASAHITNIEKIARTICTDPVRCDGVQQLVLYVGGVGIGYKLDRLLGGAFGSGLFNNVKTAYRFLALNFEEGDEIFAFGFSRGAYTARSLVGMIGMIGLLTRESMIDDKLPEAVGRYQRQRPKTGWSGSSNAEFKRDFCHAATPTKFLGVFDTVGALGVPGMLPKDHQFHDINLGDSVQCARQALAVDESRMVFAPCLWQAPTRPERVKQVWFEGAHSDVGGGYAETGLSDTALLWMASEASREGLVFDKPLLDEYVNSRSEDVLHSSMKWFYRVSNLRERIRPRPKEERGVFTRSSRNLDAPGSGVMLSSSALDHFSADTTRYRPDNLDAFVTRRSREELTAVTEPVVYLPESSQRLIDEQLATLGVNLSGAWSAGSDASQSSEGSASVPSQVGPVEPAATPVEPAETRAP